MNKGLVSYNISYHYTPLSKLTLFETTNLGHSLTTDKPLLNLALPELRTHLNEVVPVIIQVSNQ